MTSNVRWRSLLYTVPFRELVNDTPLDRNEVTDRAGEAGAEVADEPLKLTRSVETVNSSSEYSA